MAATVKVIESPIHLVSPAGCVVITGSSSIVMVTLPDSVLLHGTVLVTSALTSVNVVSAANNGVVAVANPVPFNVT